MVNIKINNMPLSVPKGITILEAARYARENIKGEIYALKGMVKCDNCGSTLVLQKANNGLQYHSYARGICKVSHHINLSILNKMIIDSI